MSENHQPRRQRRLARIFDSSPSYFLTLCTDKRAPVLNNSQTMETVRRFAMSSAAKYGVYVNCYVLMPDHVHMIITMAPESITSLGEWVKAFKAVVSHRRFKWQAGFFDHVLRSDESRSEKWEYIRMNPVRGEFVSDPEDWPYAQQFNPFDGSDIGREGEDSC